MLINKKDMASGLFFIAAGLLYGGIASYLPFGSALRMGPGYFPIILSGLMILFGVIISFRGLNSGPGTPFGVMPWRALVMILLATIIFAAFIDDLGMVPGLLLTTFIATMASKEVTWQRSLIATVSITIFCTLVFSYAVRLPIPVVGPLFDGLR